MNELKAVTFEVADVEPSSIILNEQSIFEHFRDRALGWSHRGCTFIEGSLTNNPLLVAAHASFLNHYPLTLSPDVIWLTLVQGLSQHIEADSEALRHHFVSFPGKFTLRVESEGGINPWPDAIERFSEQIRRYLKPEAYELILSDFSTTTVHSRIASEVMLMAAMKSYFDYEAMCICGIPSITLEGTTKDWEQLRNKAQKLAEYGLEDWTQQLTPILGQFVEASQGRVDRAFWNDLYQYHEDQGGTAYEPRHSFSGWIGKLFPYLAGGSANPLLGGEAAAAYRAAASEPGDLFSGLFDEPMSQDDIPPVSVEEPESCRFPGLTIQAFPRGMASAPVLWSRREVSFNGGLLGTVQVRANKALKPVPGWLVTSE